MLKNKVISIIFWIVLIVSIIFGGYKLLTSSIFDTSGGYIKNIAESKDTIGYKQDATRGSYVELFKDTDDMLGKPLRFWGIVGDSKEKYTYELKVRLDETSDREVRRHLKISNTDDINWMIIMDTSNSSGKVYKGDAVFVYGELTNIGEYNGIDTPFMNIRLIELDKDI